MNCFIISKKDYNSKKILKFCTNFLEKLDTLFGYFNINKSTINLKLDK